MSRRDSGVLARDVGERLRLESRVVPGPFAMNKLLTAVWIAATTAILCIALPAQDAKYTEFVTKFAKALEFDDEAGMDRAIKTSPAEALAHFDALTWDHHLKAKADLVPQIDALKASWQRVFATPTLDYYDRFIRSRVARDREMLYGARASETAVYRQLAEARENRQRVAFEDAMQGAVNVARSYDELGQALAAASMWATAATANNLMPDRTVEDRRQGIEYMRNFVRDREQWEWTKDIHFVKNQEWLHAEQQRLASAEREAESSAAAAAAKPDALVLPDVPEEIAPLEFAVQKQPNLDLFVKGGAIPGLWMADQVTGEGPSQIRFFTAHDLFLVRPGNNKFGVTTVGHEQDLSKNPWQPIVTSARFKPTLLYLGENKTEPYAMWFFVGGQQERYLGVTHNMQPEKEKALVYYKSASSWTAKLAGETVTFFDDNANGKLFETDPYAYGLQDRTRGDHKEAGVRQMTFDSMRVGKAPPTPINSFVKIGDQWYLMSPHDDGAKVGVRPLDPERFKTGTLDFKWTGPKNAKPELLIVSGGKEFTETHYNVAAGSTELPVGKYRISFGRIATGKGARALQAHIYNGAAKDIEVEADKTAVLELGSPFTLEFVNSGDDSKIRIDAMSITIAGRSGELYGRVSGAAPAPDVLAARSATGKGAKVVGSFMPIDVPNYIAAAAKWPSLNIEVCYFPVPEGEREGNFVLEVKAPFPGAYVGLQEKKNKLFGRLLPKWQR